MTTTPIPAPLRQALPQQSGLAFAVLVDSRATGTQRPGSDWDISLQWSSTINVYGTLGATDTLWRQLTANFGRSWGVRLLQKRINVLLFERTTISQKPETTSPCGNRAKRCKPKCTSPLRLPARGCIASFVGNYSGVRT